MFGPESLVELTKVGTVEITRARQYPLDGESTSVSRLTAIVLPGSYPLYEHEGCYFWAMRGYFNLGGLRRLGGGPGEGMYSMTGGDIPANLEVGLISKAFHREDLDYFIKNDPAVTGAEPRLIFHWNEAKHGD